MDCSWRAMLACTVFGRAMDAMSSGNNKCPCSLLPNRSHILRPDRLHHCRRLLVAVLPEHGRREEKCKLKIPKNQRETDTISLLPELEHSIQLLHRRRCSRWSLLRCVCSPKPIFCMLTRHNLDTRRTDRRRQQHENCFSCDYITAGGILCFTFLLLPPLSVAHFFFFLW